MVLFSRPVQSRLFLLQDSLLAFVQQNAIFEAADLLQAVLLTVHWLTNIFWKTFPGR